MGEEWAYGYSDDTFHTSGFTSKEEAIDECRADCDDGGYVGRMVRHTFSSFMPDVEQFLDMMGERAYEAAGEHAECWPPKISPETQAELQSGLIDLVDRWASRHGLHPEFFGVVDIVRVEPSEPDESKQEP